MTHSERKRQQKLVKKQRRTNELRKQRNVRLNMSDREWIAVAQKSPWLGCYTTGESGMYQVIAVRQGRSDLLACAFLLDTYCLGVKKCYFVRGIDMEAIRERMPQTVAPAFAMKWIQDAIAYGRKNGFEPPATCAVNLNIFEGVDPTECNSEFEFGKDGKPTYITGPHDSPEYQFRVLETLHKLGEGNFNFVLLQDSAGNFDPDIQFDPEDEDEYDGFVEDRPTSSNRLAHESHISSTP